MLEEFEADSGPTNEICQPRLEPRSSQHILSSLSCREVSYLVNMISDIDKKQNTSDGEDHDPSFMKIDFSLSKDQSEI